jgi:hypothetical protein
MSHKLKSYLDDENFLKAKKSGASLKKSRENISLLLKVLKIRFGISIF